MTYLLRRFVHSVILLFVTVTFVFVAGRTIGDPALNILGVNATEQALQTLRQNIGLDDPFIVQYARFLGDVLRGDFGVSYRFGFSVMPAEALRGTGQPVLPGVLQRLPATFFLAGVAMAMALSLAILMGTAAAVWPRSFVDRLVTVLSLAGVSIGTVSKALNNSGALRQETRQRIVDVASSIGFRPNDLAQSLHRGQSYTVGLISNDSFGRFTMPIMEGLEAVLADRRIAVFMCNATDDPERERQHVEQLMGKRVDGLVFTSRRADRRPSVDLGVAGVPIVYVFAQSHDTDAVALVPDDEGGERLATEHLIGLGRTRIAHVTGPERFEAVRLRRDGYRTALATAGLPAIDGFYLPGEWSERYGWQMVNKLFEGPGERPDGLTCGNDQIARGAAEALHELGIDVPDAVSVVGFDNWRVMAEAVRPPLTSVDLNLNALGRRAGDTIMRMIDGENISGVKRLECTLVVRESCGARAAATKS